MAKHELLKEALADAKSLREMAITNAKAALEESFAPQIKSMLSTKLQEMEEEDLKEDDDIYEMKDDKEEKTNEDLNLDEILAELEEADDSDEKKSMTEIDEVETNEVETEETEEEDGMEGEEEDEPMDLEDMSEDDLKGFIESVIADMVEAGDLEAGEDMEGEDMEGEMEDMDDEEEVNIDELLAEIESMDEEYKYEEDDKDSMKEMSTKYEEDDSKMEEMSTKYEEDDMKEEMSTYEEDDMKEGMPTYEEDDKDSMNEGELTENFLNRIAGKLTGETKSRIESIAGKITAGKKLFGSEFVEPTKEEMEDMVAAIKKDGGTGTVAVDKSTKKVFYTPAKEAKASGPSVVSIARESLQTELNEALEANKVLSTELNEVNLLNAKLLYTNRIFKSKNLTESQKVKVLSTFDKASNVNEVELVYETLNGTSFGAKKKSINENLGSASRTIGTTKTTKPIIKANDAYKRMQELAFYNVKH